MPLSTGDGTESKAPPTPASSHCPVVRERLLMRLQHLGFSQPQLTIVDFVHTHTHTHPTRPPPSPSL